MIRDRVDRDPDETAALKNIKGIPSPEKYDGKDDGESFMSWLKLMLRWMELSRITGNNLDGARTSLLGQFLTGPASEWYDDVVDNTHADGRIWVFEDAVCAMFKRFIHRSTARSAADKFHSAKYKKESGVHGLWEYMIKWSLKMPRQPDDYTFNRRFMDALPEELYVPMLTNRNVSVEKTPPTLLKRVALDQESSNRVVEEQRAAHRKQPHRESDPSTSSARSSPAAVKTAPVAPPFRRDKTFSRQRYPSGPAHSNLKGVRTAESSGQGVGQQGGNRRVTFDPTKLAHQQQATYANPPILPARTSTAAATQGTTVPGGRSIQCYNCKEYGHVMAQCPKASTPNLRISRPVDEPTVTTAVESGNIANSSEGTTPTEEATGADGTRLEEADSTDHYSDYFEDAPDGSQYDYDEPISGYESDEYTEREPRLAMMRRISGNEDDFSRAGEVNQPIMQGEVNSPWSLIAADFSIGIPGPMISNHSNVQRPGSSGPVTDPEEDDIPPLEPIPIRAASPDWGQGRALPGPHIGGPVIELPMEFSEALTEWQHFMDRQNDDEAAARLRQTFFRVVASTQHLSRELIRTRDEADRLQSQLAWTRMELAKSLQRESDTINALHRTILVRSGESQASREHIAIREEILNNPLSSTLADDAFEGNYIDDPSMTAANRELSRVLDVGAPPPAYPATDGATGRGPALRAMSFVRSPPVNPDGMITRARTGRRPIVPRIEDTGLTVYTRINGLEALVLFDSGSTGDSISPEFARVAGIRTFELENPTALQLGWAVTVDTYLDVVNLDRYDVVLGTPFMRRNGVVLDFGTGTITIQGARFSALSPQEEEQGANRRRSQRPAGVRAVTAPPPARRDDGAHPAVM
ncbi:hypothetical protein C8Q79DRAFT_1094822, partial [Trametes meyenii]